MDDLPSTERGPRQSDEESQSGTGTPRSADGTVTNKSATEENATDPAGGSELHVNRSGSGGSGGAATGDEDAEGSTGASMDELLGGDSEEGSRA